MKILVIGAHPADGVDLAGGTAYLHACNKDEVTGMTLTDGIYSHYKYGKEEQFPITEVPVRALKLFEFEKAWNTLLAKDTISLGLRDEPLLMTQESILLLVNHIRKIKPDMVITHHPNEYAHWDHATCGQMVCRALKAAMKLPGDKHWVKTVYFFGVQFRPEVSRVGVVPQSPDVLVDIGGVVLTKINALYCFESQGHNDMRMLWNRMNSFESEVGRADGLKYSEGFILYYPLKTRLLFTNEDMGFYGHAEEIEMSKDFGINMIKRLKR